MPLGIGYSKSQRRGLGQGKAMSGAGQRARLGAMERRRDATFNSMTSHPQLFGQRAAIADEAGLGSVPDYGAGRIGDSAIARARMMKNVDPAGPYSSQSQLGQRPPSPMGYVDGQPVSEIPAGGGHFESNSPFVSSGPISGGPRSPELEARLGQMRQRLGITTPMPEGTVGPQQPSEVRFGTRGTLAQATPDGGIRLLGQRGQRILERTGMTPEMLASQVGVSGVPTRTDPETGEVTALHPEQQRSLDIRRPSVLRAKRQAARLGQLQEAQSVAEASTDLRRERLGQPPMGRSGQEGRGPIGSDLLNAAVNNSLAPKDEDGEDIPFNSMSVEQLSEVSPAQAQSLIGLVDSGTLTEEQALSKARELAAKYPPNVESPLDLLMAALEQRAQEQAHQERVEEGNREMHRRTNFGGVPGAMGPPGTPRFR